MPSSSEHASQRDTPANLAEPRPKAVQAPTSDPTGRDTLQRTAGNSSVVAGMKALGSGAPLPPSAGAAHRLLGAAASSARIHSGPAAAATASAFGNGALAVTLGRDIALSSRAPALNSAAGSLLLAHEAAHVVQQGRPRRGGSTHEAEHEADVAAVAAMAGRSVPLIGSADGPQGFEAAWHQASLTDAMRQAGFTDREQDEADFSNWCRDMSQAIVPMVVNNIGAEAATTLVSILAEEKFGRSLTAEQLGAYKPPVHIDSPAGQIPADFVQEGRGTLTLASGRGTYDLEVPDYSPEHIAEQYQVNDSGVPAYIMASRQYIKDEAGLAIAAGRTPEGLAHVGNFSHTMEDLFAHSNWIEAAVGLLITQHQIPLPQDVMLDLDKRERSGQPPVETYAAELQDAAGNARPILMTGSFSSGPAGNDTRISIKSEVQNVATSLAGHANPFREGGNNQKYWDLALQILGHIEEAANADELGQMVVAQIDEIIALTHPGEAVTEATGSLVERSQGSRGIFGTIARGAARLLDTGAHAAVEEVSESWQDTLKSAVRRIVNGLGKHVDLVAIAVYVQKAEGSLAHLWKSLKDAVLDLPKTIRDLIFPKLAAAEKAFKDKMRELCDAALQKAVGVLMDGLESASATTDLAESNLGVKLEHMKDDELPDLQKQLVATIRRVAPGGEGQAAIDRIERAEPQELIGIAGDPALAEMLGALHERDKRAVLAGVGDLSDIATRIRQLENVPDWVLAGASHSQLAKDHTDSPFFGAAFAVSREADLRMMQLMRDAWAEIGYYEPSPDLAGTYQRTEEKESADANPLIDPGAAQAHRENRFLKTRDEASRVLSQGHGEHLPIEALRAVAHELIELQKARPFIGPVVIGVIHALQENPTTNAILHEVELVEKDLTPWLEEQVRRGGDRAGVVAERVTIATVARIREILRFIKHVLGRDSEDEHQPDHEHGKRTETHFASQIAALDRRRGASGNLVTPTSMGDRALDERRATARTTRESLLAEIDRIFAHPYDSTWWRSILISWARENPSVVAQAIRDRNAGRAHSHPH